MRDRLQARNRHVGNNRARRPRRGDGGRRGLCRGCGRSRGFRNLGRFDARRGRRLSDRSLRHTRGRAGRHGAQTWDGRFLDGRRGGRCSFWSGGFTCRRRRRLGGGGGRSSLGCGRGFEDATNQIRDVLGNDTELILGFENAAKALVEERDQLFGCEPHLFGELKNAYFTTGRCCCHVSPRGPHTRGTTALSHQEEGSAGFAGRASCAPNLQPHRAAIRDHCLDHSLRFSASIELLIKPYSAAADARPG